MPFGGRESQEADGLQHWSLGLSHSESFGDVVVVELVESMAMQQEPID